MSKRKGPSVEDAQPGPAAFHNAVSRAELITLAAILVLGILHRGAFLERTAVEHFDEGVYASKVYFSLEGGWPMQHLYAPPLLPLVIESLVTFLGPTSLAAMLPSLACGTATIALVWWIGRTWFSPAAGLAAALLAATSEVHALFSRAALTDVPLTLFVLAAVFAWERSVTNRDWRWTLGAGLLMGLAGLTKYNGWLPLGVAGITGLAWLAALRISRIPSETKPAPLAWHILGLYTLAMGLIAAAMWTPYLWGLRPQGGYAAVAKNHAKYVVGLTGWLDSAAQQTWNHRYLESWLTCVGVGAAWIVLRTFTRCKADERTPQRPTLVALDTAGQALLLTAAAMFLGTFPLLALLGGYWLMGRKLFASLGGCTAAVAWLMLVALTPLYHPYVRLTLPWLAFAWLLAAAALGQSADLLERPADASSRTGWLWLVAGVIALGLGFAINPHVLRAPVAWQPRTGMQQATQHFAAIIAGRHRREPQAQPAVFVLAEPAVVFHLYAAGQEVVKPVQEPAPGMQDPNRPDARVWLVVGPEGERDPSFAASWPMIQDAWQLVETVEVELSDLMLLDLENPRQFDWSHPPRQALLRLYVWRRGGSLPSRR